MKKKLITEAVRYGNREKNSVLSSLDDYGFGIEIELVKPQIHDLYDYIDRIETVEMDVTPGDFTYALENEYDDGFLHSFAIGEFYDPEFGMLGKHIFDIEFIELLRGINENLSDNSLDGYKDELYYDSYIKIKNYYSDNNIDIDEETEAAKEIDAVGLLDYQIVYLMPYRDTDDFESYKSTLESLLSSYKQFTASFPRISQPFNELSDEEKDILNMFFMDEFTKIVDILKSEDMIKITNRSDFKDVVNEIDLNRLDDFFRVKFGHARPRPIQAFIDALGISSDVIRERISEIMYEYFSEAFEQHNYSRVMDYLSSVDVIDMFYDKTPKFKYTFAEEGSDQIELIQETVHGSDIIEAYKEAFEIIEALINYGFRATNDSGLHMSISYKNGSEKMDFVKFILLSNIYNVIKDDKNTVREHVQNIFENLEDYAFGRNFLEFLSDNTIEDISNEIYHHIETMFDTARLGVKFKSVNIEHYFTQNGRVELRFFGGHNYDFKEDEYFDILIRCMYALKLACDPNEKRKEYLGTLYRFANKRFENKYSLSIASYKSNLEKSKQLLSKIPPEAREDIAEISHPVSNDSRIYSKWYTYINVVRGVYGGNLEYSKGSNEFVDYLTSCVQFYKTHTR